MCTMGKTTRVTITLIAVMFFSYGALALSDFDHAHLTEYDHFLRNHKIIVDDNFQKEIPTKVIGVQDSAAEEKETDVESILRESSESVPNPVALAQKQAYKPIQNDCSNNNSAAVCLPGWYLFEDICFVISDFTATFSKARRICEFKDSQLLKLSSSLDGVIQDLMNNTWRPPKHSEYDFKMPNDTRTFGRSMWIGFHDLDEDDQFRWNDETETPSYSNMDFTHNSTHRCAVKSINYDHWQPVSCESKHVFACYKSINDTRFYIPSKPKLVINKQTNVAVLQDEEETSVHCEAFFSDVRHELGWCVLFNDGEIEVPLDMEIKSRHSLIRRANTFLDYTCLKERFFVTSKPVPDTIAVNCYWNDITTVLPVGFCVPNDIRCVTGYIYHVEKKKRIPKIRLKSKWTINEGDKVEAECWLEKRIWKDADLESNAPVDKLSWMVHMAFNIIRVYPGNNQTKDITVSEERTDNGTLSRFTLRNVTKEMHRMVITCYPYDITELDVKPCEAEGMCASTVQLRVKTTGEYGGVFSGKGLWIAQLLIIFFSVVIVLLVLYYKCCGRFKMVSYPDSSSSGSSDDDDYISKGQEISTSEGISQSWSSSGVYIGH